MEENLKEIKKKVAEDWQNAFPQLVKYAQNKYYKIVGPVLVGIELVKPSNIEKYSPHFVIYSLWGNKMGKDLKACLSGPIVLKPFLSKRGQEIFIPYSKHSTEFLEAIKAVKRQIPIPLEGVVSLESLFFAIDEHSKAPPLNASPNSYLQAVLQESKLELALCAGNDDQIQSVLSKILNRKWDVAHFQMLKIDVNQWLKKVKEKVNNRSEFQSQVILNKQEKKLMKLHASKLEA